MALRRPARERRPILPDRERTVVVLGNGLAGQRLCARLAERAAGSLHLVVFAEEPLPAYDRVHLSDVLAKRAIEDLELAPAAWYAANGIELHVGDPALHVDLAARRVVSRAGRSTAYDALVFATGSSPVLPPVPGADLPQVIGYRNAADVLAIARGAERALARSRRVAVVGGGLLGLEAAWALHGLGCETELFERAPHLLPRQLDRDASRIVAGQVGALGIRLHLAQWLQRIDPAAGGGVRLGFATGAAGPFELVVVAAGVRPRDELARAAGLRCHPRGGIEVDDRLAASAPGVYAVGECARHDDVVHGLASPCLAMAEMAADVLLGEPARFRGAAPPATRLKIDSLDVSVAGAASDDGPGIVRVRFRDGDAYRCLVLQRGELIGAIGVGAWPEWHAVQEAVARRRFVRPWERARLVRRGRLWTDGGRVPIERWSDATPVCTCMGVDCGTLRRALAEGCRSSSQLSARTGAATRCGTCRPLLEALAGERAGPVRAAAQRGLLAAGVLAAAGVATVVAAPAVPFADSVHGGLGIDRLWRESALRQATGFTTLGLGIASLGLPLRKRSRFLARVSQARWRTVHAGLGVATLVGFGVHTGLRLGANLDRALALCFVALAGLGALAGLVTAIERRLGATAGARLRRAATWAHVLALWPFPLLVLFHVLKVYWY